MTVTDSRIASAVVLREGASFTYNMDYAVMERAIFEVIKFAGRGCPARMLVELTLTLTLAFLTVTEPSAACVGFGVPKNQAGLYTVTVITDNRNYNTGVGLGGGLGGAGVGLPLAGEAGVEVVDAALADGHIAVKGEGGAEVELLGKYC